MAVLDNGNRIRILGILCRSFERNSAIGLVQCRSVDGGIYEVRSNLAQNRIARVLFYFDRNGRMVLLHGFIKKTQKTPEEDLELARRNKKKHERSQ